MIANLWCEIDHHQHNFDYHSLGFGVSALKPVMRIVTGLDLGPTRFPWRLNIKHNHDGDYYNGPMTPYPIDNKINMEVKHNHDDDNSPLV